MLSKPLSALAALAVTFAFLVSPASALTQKPYDAAAFEAAQKAGGRVIVHVTAPWCSNCKAQHKAIDSLAKKPEYDDVQLFSVDFDSQKDVADGFSADTQSTIIAFSGDSETGRLVGQSDVKEIAALFDGASAQ